MASLEDTFQAAVDAKVIGGCALVASDASGNFRYEKAFGNQSLDPSSPASKQPIDLDAVFIIASCTKLMTTIAALQCIEKALVTLDEDLSPYLKELQDIQIVSFAEASEEPVYTKAKNKITLRMLLTHTSGLVYDSMSPKLERWRASRGESGGAKGLPILERINTPLEFEPGTSWLYGTGLDWAGILVSRLTNLSLQDYMQANIWGPLGIQDMTFHLEQRPDMRSRLVALGAREGIPDPLYSLGVWPTTGKLEAVHEKLYDDPTADEYGGAGAYATPRDYIKILLSILRNDSTLLQPSTVDEMFTPQLNNASREAYTGFMAAPELQDTFASIPTGTGLDWGLGGMMITADLAATGRKKGTISWSGLPNLLWTIDREAGLCALFAAQVVPFGDKQLHSLQQTFEKEIYRRLEESK